MRVSYVVSIVSILDKGYDAINGLIWPSQAVLSSIVFWHSIRTNSGHSLVYSQTDKAHWYQQKSIPTLLVCLDKTTEYNEQNWARFLSLAPSKLRLCSANHRTGYCNLSCDWLSTVWAYSEQETENRPCSHFDDFFIIGSTRSCHFVNYQCS